MQLGRLLPDCLGVGSGMAAFGASVVVSCHCTQPPVRVIYCVDSLRGIPDAGTDEFDSWKVVFGAFVVSGADTTEMLDAVEEPFD